MDVCIAFPFGGAPLDVFHGGGVEHRPCPSDRMQGPVQMSVAVEVEPLSGLVAGGRRVWGHFGQRAEGSEYSPLWTPLVVRVCSMSRRRDWCG